MTRESLPTQRLVPHDTGVSRFELIFSQEFSSRSFILSVVALGPIVIEKYVENKKEFYEKCKPTDA